ncbi:MAG: helix-turn-helix transcriptional regulator [Clostridia bacterium]|nr:helix-turn-helix transcriptional regulator [Clostridia bacterium]
MTFGAALKKSREEAGLTQTEFAKLLGVSFSSINRYENGHHKPTPIVLNAIKIFFKKKGIPLVYDRAEG